MSRNHVLGQRQTRQRKAILGTIIQARGPLAVAEIHERARQATPRVSLATIYRTLNLLQKLGQIRCILMPTGEVRYGPAGPGHHEHFRCRCCQTVFDLHAYPLPPHGPIESGFVVEDHELILYGLCPTCAH